MFHRCLISSCLLGWHLKTFTAFPSAASCHSIISYPRHKVGLVSEISQSYPHPPDPRHLYNPLPVCVFTYKGSLSWLLRMSLWCMACCSQSPLHLRMGLVPSVPKQPGKFHCESAKVRAVHSGSTAIRVSWSPGNSLCLCAVQMCIKRLISVKPQNSLAGWLAWV